MAATLLADLDAGPLVPPFAARVLLARTPEGQAELGCRVLVLDAGSAGVVLIDTGFGRADCADPGGRLGRPFVALTGPRLEPTTPVIAQLDALGIAASDVRHVLMTHLDLDHSGGLPDFPHATVHVHQRELDAATRRATASHRGRYLPVHMAHQPKWSPLAALRSDAADVRGGFALGAIPGLPAAFRHVELPGHSPGHSGFLIALTGGSALLHVGDAILEGREVRSPNARPSVAVRVHHRLFDDQPEVARATRARLSAFFASEPDVAMVGSHDRVWIRSLEAAEAALST